MLRHRSGNLEYIERNPEGYRYSRFCELHRNWEGKLSVIRAAPAVTRLGRVRP
jgi:transposase